MIAQHRAEYPLRLMCRVLAVSPAGFYAWQRRGPSARQQEDTRLGVQVAAFHRRSRRRYGSPRILRDLRLEAGERVSRKRVARLMREAGLVGTPRRRFRVTTQSDSRPAPAPNRLARQFAVAEPNRVWVTDGTYLVDRRRLAVPGDSAGSRLPSGGGLGAGAALGSAPGPHGARAGPGPTALAGPAPISWTPRLGR